jgi:hypothetical protein
MVSLVDGVDTRSSGDPRIVGHLVDSDADSKDEEVLLVAAGLDVDAVGVDESNPFLGDFAVKDNRFNGLLLEADE